MSYETLPQDFEAERSLLATLCGPGMLNPNEGSAEAHQALGMLNEQVWVAPQHQAIFRALKTLYSQAAEVNLMTLKAQLESVGELGRVNGFTGLVEILAFEEVNRPTQLAEIVTSRWKSRRLMALAQEATRAAYNLEDPAGVAGTLQTQLADLFSDGHFAGVHSAAEILELLAEGRPFRDQTKAEKLAWLGLAEIDDALEASPGHVVIVAARPGVGKSALAVQGACITAGKGGKALIVSLEMDTDEVYSRIAARMSGSSASRYRKGTWTFEDARSLHDQQTILEAMDVWAHPSGVSWNRVEAVIRDSVRTRGTTSVWLDYFTLVRKPDAIRGMNDAAAWGQVSTGIKRLAQELGICIVLLSQLNREGDGVEPKLSDLRETGQLEQDGNAVLMLWPKDPRAMESPVERKSIYVKLAKNRSGMAGWKRELVFEGATGRMTPLVRETNP